MRQNCAAAKFSRRIARSNSFRFPNGLRFSQLPQPKFRIGQYVSSGYWCDDHLDPDKFGKFIKYYGFITGVLYDCEETKKNCWTYQVHFTLYDGEPATEVNWGIRELMTEDELKRAV